MSVSLFLPRHRIRSLRNSGALIAILTLSSLGLAQTSSEVSKPAIAPRAAADPSPDSPNEIVTLEPFSVTDKKMARPPCPAAR